MGGVFPLGHSPGPRQALCLTNSVPALAGTPYFHFARRSASPPEAANVLRSAARGGTVRPADGIPYPRPKTKAKKSVAKE